MKKTILTLAFALAQIVTFAQAPAIQWQKTIPGDIYTYETCMKQTTDGGYVFAGYNYPTSYANFKVVKVDSSGLIQWQISLGGSGDDMANSIQQTTDGGYIVAGSTTSTNGDVTGNHGGADYWIVKLSASGVLQWQKTYGGSFYDYAKCIQQTSDGGYIVAGQSDSINGDVTGNHGNQDAWVVKLNSSGVIQWQKSLGGTNIDRPTSLQQTSDGGFIMVSYTLSTDGDVAGNNVGGYWVVKLNASGVLQWQNTYGGTGTGYDFATSIQQTSDGGYVVGGHTNSSTGDVTGFHGGYGDDFWIVKISNSGVLQWQKTLGGINDDWAQSTQQTADGGYIVAGLTYSNDGDVTGFHGGNGADFWIVKLNSNGALQWQKTLGGTDDDQAISILQTIDGGYVVSGGSSSIDGDITSGQTGWWLVKLGPDLATTDFQQQNITLFPNPATNKLHLQTANNISLDKITITDLTGKVVLTQTSNTTQVNVELLASGMYIIEAVSGDEKLISKFLKD